MPNQTKYASYVETSFAGGGSGVWSNPQNAESSDDLYAVAVCNEATSEFLLFRGFFFSLPTNVTIDGFEVGIERHADGVAIFDETVRLVKGGAVAGDSSADTVNPWSIGVDQTAVYGGSDQLWGETWTRQNVNSSGFGAVMTAENLLVGDGTASVDSLYVTVYYHFEEVALGGSSVGGVAIVDPWVMVGGVQLGGVVSDKENPKHPPLPPLPAGVWDNPETEDKEVYEEYVEAYWDSDTEYQKHYQEWRDSEERDLAQGEAFSENVRSLAYGADCTSAHQDAASYGCITTGLVALYEFDSVGDPWKDYAGSYDLTSDLPPDLAGFGMVGDDMPDFDGTTEYLNNTSVPLTTKEDFTVALFVSGTDVPASFTLIVGGHKWDLVYDPYNGRYRFSVGHSTGVVFVNTDSVMPIALNIERLIVLRKDADYISIQMKWDGGESFDCASHSLATGYVENDGFGISDIVNFDGWGLGTARFRGWVDEVGLWQRCLTDSEADYLWGGSNGILLSTLCGGGVEVGGFAGRNTHDIMDVEGGVEVGGFAGRNTHDIMDVEGGVSAGGTSPSLSFYAPLGGAFAGGESTVLSSIVTSGGVSASGENHAGGVHNLSGEGGVKLGGEANDSGVIHRIVVADGGVEVDQEPDAHLLPPTADYGITGRFISSTGGVYVTNLISPTIVNYRFELNKTFLWHLRTYLVKDLTFLWSTGLLIIYWYRVIAKPIEDCDCCKKVITNVHARTVAELCEKLSERNWKWKIETIEKFRRPAALGNAINGWENQQEAIDDYDLESNALENCHDLESIEFCEIPQCANHCIDFDLRVSFSFDMSEYSVNAFHDYESGEGESEDRAIRISGDADITHFRIIPDFPYESSDYGANPNGNETDPQRMAIEISGSAVAWSSHQRSYGGGIITAVEANTSFTNWQFIGGVWPFVVTASPSIAESVSSLNQEGSVIEGDQPWLSLNNALLPDGSDAFTDISWGENSEFLVLRGFRLNIPLVGPRISQVVKIDRIQVHIDRWTTQVGTEDLRFFLVSGDEVISNNIEQTDFRWPLIPTMITYGDDPTSFEPNQNRFRNIDELVWNPWDINVINSADFGVAIQVHDVVGAGGTFGRVDHITLEVTYDYVEHQTLRTGGSARQISSAYNHTSDGSIQIGGKVDTYVTWNYLPNAIGLGQPTSVVFGGSHAMALSYIVSEQNTLWLDAGNPVDEANTGVVAYWTNDATNQPLSDFLDGTFDSSAQWQDTTNANVADINFAYVDISPDDLDSDFLVVRNLGLNLGEHWKVHGLRVIMGLRGTRSSEDDFTGDPPIFGGGTIEGSGGIRVGGGWTVGGVRVSGVADETFEDITDVRDRYVYLVRGDNIISDNLAKDLPWPAFPGYSVAYYGSTGFDGEPQFRDQDLSPWDVEEINDSEFGVAIAVSNLGVTVDTVAEIDGIAIELTVEAFGRILTVSSHVNLLGSSGAYPDHQPGRGGMVVGGEGEVKPFWDEVDGGTSVNGKSIVQQHFFYDVTVDGTTEIEGSIVIGGGAFATDTIFDHVTNGGCGVSGLAKEEFSRQIFVSDGNAIFILGGAEIRATSAGSVTVSIQADMQIIDFQGIFSEDVDEKDIKTITDEAVQCGCLTIPMFVTLKHNILERNNIFVQFLARNNFFMSRTIELSHNVPNDSWQANFHYRGLSSDSNTEEKWDFVFELQCTNTMGAIDIGRNVWKLAISVFRENLITGEDFDTRIVIGLMPESICDTNANELEFNVVFNTQTNVATVIPEDVVVYQSTLFDNIGLFKTSSWVSYPELVLSISQSGFSEPQQRVDLYDAVVIGEGPPLPSS